MTFTQDIFGSCVEMLMTVFLMRLFSTDYFIDKIRLSFSIVMISISVALLDLLQSPTTVILNYVVIFLFLSISVKRNKFNVFFELVFATAILTLLEHILAMVFYQIQGMASLDFINICIQLLISFIICTFIGFNRTLQKFIQLFYEKYQEEFYFISVTIFCFSMIELYLWKRNDEVVLMQSTIISIYTTIWFALCLFLLKKLIENRRQKENIRLHEQYMETTENLLDGLYSDKHDFNKHLQAILGICQYQEPKQAVNNIQLYIETLQEKVSHQKKSTISFNTGNGVINALLYSKAKEAKKRDIQLFYLPSGTFPTFPCEQYELVQIIGNLLDNAFEYVENLETEKRMVMLFMGEQEEKKCLEVRNTYCEETNRTISVSQSTKFGDRRGYGLKNVRAIVLKYHGKLDIYQEENEFVVEVLF